MASTFEKGLRPEDSKMQPGALSSLSPLFCHGPVGRKENGHIEAQLILLQRLSNVFWAGRVPKAPLEAWGCNIEKTLANLNP